MLCVLCLCMCVLADGKLEAIGYVAAEGKVTAPLVNAVNMVSHAPGLVQSLDRRNKDAVRY